MKQERSGGDVTRKGPVTPERSVPLPVRVAVIGLGNIARSMLDLCARDGSGRIELTGVLVRAPRAAEATEWLGRRAPVVTKFADLLATRPTLIAECAGHAALRAFGEPVLKAGCDLVTLSSGAF